jgi:hypothetical protein
MRKRARTDLCGGRSVMVVPTATIDPDYTAKGLVSGPHHFTCDAAEAIRLADHTRHQTALRLLPFLFVLYVTNYLDRTSLAYAAIGMKRDLGFSDSVTGLGLGVFFIRACSHYARPRR